MKVQKEVIYLNKDEIEAMEKACNIAHKLLGVLTAPDYRTWCGDIACGTRGILNAAEIEENEDEKRRTVYCA